MGRPTYPGAAVSEKRFFGPILANRNLGSYWGALILAQPLGSDLSIMEPIYIVRVLLKHICSCLEH